MPRPLDVPDWVFPGTLVVNNDSDEVYRIHSITDHIYNRWEVRLIRETPGSPPGASIELEIHEVENRFTPSVTEAGPSVDPNDVLQLALLGLINVAPGLVEFPAVVVMATTDIPVSLGGQVIPTDGGITIRLSRAWDHGTIVMTDDRLTRVSFDGGPAEDYYIREFSVGGNTHILLEVAEADDVRDMLDAPTTTVEVTQTAYDSVQRISVWERLSRMRSEGPAAAPGGTEHHHRALDTDTTPERVATEE